MAQPGTDTPPVEQRPNTKQDRVLNFRVDEDLAIAVDDFAEKYGIKTRSQACRVLLAAGLGESGNQIAAREAIFLFAARKNEFVARFAEKMRSSVQGILEATFGGDDTDEGASGEG